MRKLKLLLLTIALPILAVSLWGYVALNNHKANGFVRNFMNIAASQNLVETKHNIVGIAGQSEHHIFMRTATPSSIIQYDLQTGNTSLINLGFETDKKARQNFKLQFDGQNFTAFVGNYPKIWLGSLKGATALREVLPQTLPISDGLRYADSNFLVRSYDPLVKDYTLKTLDKNGMVISKEKSVSILQHDNGLSSQSTLLYDKDRVRFYMIYKLFNSVVCFDTNLNLIYHVHSIDTISTPSFKEVVTGNIGAKHSTYSAPPRFSNFRACLSDKYLFIHSKIAADNQNNSDLVIDLYDKERGGYKFSFLLPETSGKQLTDFTIVGSQLFAVFNHGKQLQTLILKQLP